MPLIMSVTNTWNEGETMETVSAALKAVQEKAMAVEGVISFQYSINEETKTNVVTEIYTDASVIGKFFAAIGDPAEAFKAITTTETVCCGPKDQVDAAAGALGQFSPQLYYMDGCGAAVNTAAAGTEMKMPLILTVQNKWAEGATLEDVQKCFQFVQKTALGVDGVFSFQYAINEETKTNQVTEIYRDGSVVGAFFGAIGDAAEVFKSIETTRTRIAGPKEQVDGAAAAVPQFSPEVFYSDATGAACLLG